jgi:beta-lactamase class A
MICELILLMSLTVGTPPDLRGQIEQIAREAQGRVGAAVLVVETGETVAFHGDEHFPMQSVYKLPIGLAVLHEVEQGRLKLEQQVRVEKSDLVSARVHSPIRDKHPKGGVTLTVRECLRAMLVESDGTASDILLRLVGGPARVTEYLRGLGVQDVVVATSEQEMAQDELVQYQNWATPAAMAGLLRTLQTGRGLSAESRALLLQFMIETTTFPHRLKGRLPAGTTVAHKTGSSGVSNGLARATNDVGIITLPDGRHLVVVVFVSDSTAADATRDDVIAKIARAAWDWRVPPH